MGFTGLAGTLLGPLTTTWTMAPSCTVHVLNCATCNEGFRGQKCVVPTSGTGTGGPEDNTDCWPPARTQIAAPRHPFLGWGYYSPGLACPAGYTTACTGEYGKRAEWAMEFTLFPGETAVGCCPEGFKCDNNNGNTCVAVVTSGTQTEVPTAMCSGSQLVSLAQATFPDVITTTATTTGVGAAGAVVTQVVTREITLRAPMFQLNYQLSDLASSASFASSTTVSALRATSSDASTRGEIGASTTTNSTPSANTASAFATSSGQSGLSTGAIVGVGIGAALGGIVLGMLAILLFTRKRKRKEAVAMDPQGVNSGQWPGEPHPIQAQKHYYEADTTVVAEMPIQSRFFPGFGPQPVEMPARAA